LSVLDTHASKEVKLSVRAEVNEPIGSSTVPDITDTFDDGAVAATLRKPEETLRKPPCEPRLSPAQYAARFAAKKGRAVAALPQRLHTVAAKPAESMPQERRLRR